MSLSHDFTPAERSRPAPWLRLGIERLLVSSDVELREDDVPVLELRFRYGARGAEPNLALEECARRILESFGAVELACLPHYEPAYGSRANYVVAMDGDAHTYCSFGAYAVPQLRALGWQVEIDEGYPYAVLSGEEPWYAAVESQPDEPDWFSFELGVIIDGRRVSLLPALLDLLRSGDSLGSLLRRSVKFAALPTPNGRFLPVPMARLRPLLRVVRDLHEGRRSDELRCPALQLAVLGEIDRALPKLRWEGRPALIQRLVAPPEPVPAPPGLRTVLRDYQLAGVAWLQRLREIGVGGVLADDMGLGKTLQTIAHLVIEKHWRRLDAPALVVAPTSLAQNWQREIKRFAPQLRTVLYHGPARRRLQLDRCDVVITTYPLLVRDEKIFADKSFHMLILDEAQTVKNRASKAHRAAAAVLARHRLALTGTPIENNLDELHALYDLVAPGLLGSGEAFRNRFRRPIEGGDEERLEDLRRLVSPYMLRRLKEGVARELPPKTEIVRPVDLLGEQRELYESIRIAAHADVRKVIREKGLAASTVPVLDALLKLRQVCCDPRLCPMPAARRAKRSAKLETLLDMMSLELTEGRRMLLFSQFTSMLAIIGNELRARGVAFNLLTGATVHRQKQVDDFQGGAAPVFLISLKAGGTGLTLTAADTVIHYDPWWNPAAQAQATDRAYRIGQTKPVFVYNLIAAGSVEERILRLQEHKRRLADAIVGTAAARAPLTMADVEDLFAPLS